MWKWRYIYIYIYKDTKLMLGQLAQCGGVFLGGGGRCIHLCGGGGCCYGLLVLRKCTGVSQRKY